MFRELLAAWRGKDALSRMFGEFDRMLGDTHWMFQQAVEVFFSRIDWQAVQDPLYARDKEVNELERSIRAGVVKYLTLQPEGDVAACLVLMSVVKDAERIGDYAKNIFEVGKFYTREFTARRYLDPLERARMKVEDLFRLTKEAFGASDPDKARAVLREFTAFSRECNDLVVALLRERDSLPTDEAVAYSLLGRHLKRVGAHLANISSAVVAPVHRIDFIDEAGPGDIS